MALVEEEEEELEVEKEGWVRRVSGSTEINNCIKIK